MAWLGIPIIDKILGIGEKAADRLIPDKNKAQDQAHEGRQTQAGITLEGERQRNYFTPRAVLMYALVLPVVYAFILQPFGQAFGLALPEVDLRPALSLLMFMLGGAG